MGRWRSYLVVFAGIACLAWGQAAAQCALDEPISSAEAESNEFLATLCGLEWPPVDPCPEPDTPQLEAGSTRAQGVVLTAEVGGGISSARAVWWDARRLTSQGSLEKLWQHRSVQGFGLGELPAGTVVRFGAPGLAENADHVFRVAFETTTGLLTCWSDFTDYTDPISTTDFGVDGSAPALPGDMSQRVQDDFDRPATDPAYGDDTRGDGLGPEEVWTPSDKVEEGGSVSIAQNQTHAAVTQASGMVYERDKETDHRTYAESKQRVGKRSRSGVLPLDPYVGYK